MADTDKVKGIVREFDQRFAQAEGKPLERDTVDLLWSWLAQRIGGQERDATDEIALDVFDGKPMILLIGEGGVRLVTVDAKLGQVDTSYLPPLLGGEYAEQVRNPDGNRLELDMEFRHPRLPGPIRYEHALTREIDTPPVTRMRNLFRSWAEGRP